MSTRSNIKITDGETTIYLYRHWDGYLAETGADLLEKVREYRDFEYCGPAGFAMHLIAQGATQNELAPEHVRFLYELTDGVHGDIQHFYTLHLAHDPTAITYEHAEGYGPELETQTKLYTRSELIELVNTERRQANQRIDHLCKSNPAYAEAYGSDRYEMLTA